MRRTNNRIAAILLISIGGCITPAPQSATTVRIIDRDTRSLSDTAGAAIQTMEVHDVASRGVRTRMRVETVADPVAVAVLFAGGRGVLNLSANGKFGWGTGNFLIRSRPLFARRGIITASIDAPSDRGHTLHGFRGTTAHAADIGAAIAHLRKTFGLPVWLIGTSRGTNSVANAAIRLAENKPDGIVLSASMLAANNNGDHLFDYDLGQIALPTLIVHHRQDACRVTPTHEVAALEAALTKARPVTVRLYDGGIARGNPCQARHYHGFNGIEETVVNDIAAWMKKPVP